MQAYKLACSVPDKAILVNLPCFNYFTLTYNPVEQGMKKILATMMTY